MGVIFLSDIDECTFNMKKCNQRCNNTIGGYSCSCVPGFALDSNGFTCNGKETAYLPCNCFKHELGSNGFRLVGYLAYK